MTQPSEFPMRPTGLLTALALFALIANGFSFLVVNYHIYWARYAFIAAHPDIASVQPPTISKAISDPSIGAPFAFWISLCAVLLVFGMLAVALVQISGLRHGTARAPKAARVAALAALAMVPMQLVASVGMVVLSNWTFPDYNDAHMLGSYLFFTGQALVVLSGLVASIALIRSPVAAARIHAAGGFHPVGNRLRAWISGLGVVLVLFYLALFILKDVDFGWFNAPLYLTYVTTEPICISTFLAFMLTFHADLVYLLRRRARVPAQQGA